MSKQIITLGLYLDGQRAIPPSNTLGEITVGPKGLLAILETQLGLLADQPSQAERIVQYRDCLASADSASRFYHASFVTDALGTASTLLGWRDLWYLNGWNGQAFYTSSKHLSDLADVEYLASQRVAPSLGQRLAHVLIELEKRQPPITELLLLDPIGSFPARWQAVLGRLPVKFIDCIANAESTSFLGQLQHQLSLAAQGQPFDRLTWQTDGSVLVARSETRALAASWLARQLNNSTPALLVSSADSTRLDAHLSSAGHPRQGFRETNTFRPTLQLLPLALELLWTPLNFNALVQFLTHPISPLPGFARRQLAAKVADAPGIGGKRWEKILTDIDQHYGSEQAPKVREQIRIWVEHLRFGQDEGAPIVAVIDRVRVLVEFFRLRLAVEDIAQRIAFKVGYTQCNACLASLIALQSQGIATIRHSQLQKLVTQATASGSDNPLLVPEVGAHLAITHPGAAIRCIDRVFWWQLTTPNLPNVYPWSKSELCILYEAGVQLPSNDIRLSQTALEWLRPVLAARQQLVLVLPPPGEEVHPLWQMIEAVVTNPEIESLEHLLTESSSLTQSITQLPLPVRKRWLQLPDAVSVPLSTKESFSSLELLLFNPCQWLLKYPAQLRPSNIIGLGGDFRMLGNLAHGLVELYYQRPDALSMSDVDFDRWFATTFEQLVDEEGATLRMSGRGADLQSFHYRLHQSMQTLRQQVALAGMVAVTPEMAISGHFTGGQLVGSVDLVMQNPFGGQVIVDMKWSGVRKFPEKLKHNSHLQLAIYAELLRQKSSAWPSVAYYVIDKARLFASDDRAFPSAEVIASANGENTPQLWFRFLESWKWRKAQIEVGRFEVALESIEATSASIPPDSAMEPEYLNEAYNDYRTLAGWE
ncbi:MAG: PD-(D/E)XK nuclease family protein [Methylococcaceae bacterium]|nr:PD-(D/E)XK nuclease family protein [Methylococcaceae bacterium]